MFETLFTFLESLDHVLWSFLGFPLLMVLGLYLSYKSQFVQIRKFPTVIKTFFSFFKTRTEGKRGIHPIKAFFACIGGCVGIGNIVAICTAVQIGGPGALLWIWLTAIIGMILKYSEVYLGVRYRVTNATGGYNGGPMYYLQKAFKSSWVPRVVCVLLCIYGVEVYQFSVMANSISVNFDWNPFFVTAILLVCVILAVVGGVARVGEISGAMIPLFIICYLGMGLWVLWENLALIPSLVMQVFASAFTGHAATGAFVGSGLMLTVSQGIKRGCYTGDVGIGYASIIHSESSAKVPERQASLAIVDIFLDTFTVCTTSILVILLTGVWKEPLHESMLVQVALSKYFPYMHYFMPFFLFLLGYSTIIAYFCVGLKCADFLSPKRGKILYYIYATIALALFSFVETRQALVVMSLTQVLLLFINLYGFWKLQNEISYDLDAQPEEAPIPIEEPSLAKVKS